MSKNLEDWETQQDAKRAAAHKEGPLSFLEGGGAAASRKNREERRISDQLAMEAQERHKTAVETAMKALRNAIFPDEVAHFQALLLKLDLTPEEQKELQKVLWEKIK
ncbi:MAG TPA: hypothetical protein VNG51_12710 [Ktedonobacteraceae bacterium]|nr:hypothetical protein [Ktedonobacteraceae bacterium]